jgi:DNA-binding MarR family transcriptional regulator
MTESKVGGHRASTLTARAAALLQRLVNQVSHSTGASLAVMQSAGLTLPQVLLLNRVMHGVAASISSLAARTGGSLPAVSQMIDRLVRQGYLVRHQDASDRRRGVLTVTSRARAVLRRLAAARAAEYARGLGRVSPKHIGSLERVLGPLVAELESSAILSGETRGARKR